MGTTLTGTTPQDTYDSLIKVTDNGPLSGTAKYLSDGLGNDSALALSTAGVGVGTTTISSVGSTKVIEVGTAATGGTLTLGGSTAFRISGSTSGVDMYYAASAPINIYTAGVERVKIDAAGNVGIGTSAPAEVLHVKGNQRISAITGNSATAKLDLLGNNGGAYGGSNVVKSRIESITAGDAFTSYLAFSVNNSGNTLVEKCRVTNDGLTFNGDTAAANALDDYEEGTWTMGISFGSASVGVTYDINTGTYTKIGRQVTVNGVLVLTNKGSSTGGVLLTGLPFTIGSANAFYAAATLRMENVTFANQFQAYGGIGSTVVAIDEITEAGVNGSLTHADFANNSTIMISLTYFV